MAHLYFDEHLTEQVLRAGALVEVTGDEARHAVRVSRLRVGEHTLIGNGAGSIGAGEVTHVTRDAFTVRIDDARMSPRPTTQTVLVQALAKGDRDERAIEQATEFGVDVVVPFEASRSVSRWGEQKAERGVQKWSRIVREAAKQSLRPWVPDVKRPVDTAGLTQRAKFGPLIVLHPGADRSLSNWVNEHLLRTEPDSHSSRQSASELTVVVGPEGGFTSAELEELATAGAHLLSLGDTVLRTSSAGPAALAVLNVALGRW